MRLHLMRFGLVAVVAMAALSMSSRLAAQVPASDDSGAASSPEGPAGAAGTTGTASEKLKLDPNGRSDTPNFFLHIQLRPSTDKTYGFTKENPISTGISTEPPRQGATMMRLMLNSLRGPAGEAIEYERDPLIRIPRHRQAQDRWPGGVYDRLLRHLQRPRSLHPGRTHAKTGEQMSPPRIAFVVPIRRQQ